MKKVKVSYLGFPGWHIECSVMSSKYLGKQFDVHTGGQDHIPVHHTNEIAQSEAGYGVKPWVKYWIHFAWLLFGGKKVSKSDGGLFTLSQLEEKGFSSLAFRYLCLSIHYKKPLNFSLDILESSQNAYERLKNIISELKKNRQKVNKKSIEGAKKQFLEIINNDFNMPKAISFLWEILREEKLNDSEKYELALDFDRIFGLKLGEEEKISVPHEVQRLVDEREMVRAEKNFKKADDIREKVKKLGYIIEDRGSGARVRKI